MGNESSSVDADEAALLAMHINDADDDDGRHAAAIAEAADEAAAEFCGFRVLGIQEQSPAARVGFVSFFDFILSANGIRLDTRDSTFMELIAQSEEQAMQLEVYNIKSQTKRELTLTPSRQWPGKGLLGVTIRFDSFEHAEDQLLHVLEVVRGSPADAAGLRPDSDYLLGTPERVFRDADDLHDEILDALEDSFQCYVYNTGEDVVRIVRIAPSENWGGGGVLGAEVGHGVLHRLPSSCRDTVGASVGFVALSSEARAATDPYLRQVSYRSDGKKEGSEIAELPELPELLELPQPQPPSTEGEMSTQDTTTPTSKDEAAVISGDHSERERNARSASQQENVAASTVEAPPPATTTTASSTAPPSTAVATPELSTPAAAAAAPPAPDSASTPVAAPPAKPRYAARIDPRFPISTVTVFADPTQVT